MSERIQQLEVALALVQSSVSLEEHPLLRDELLLVKYGGQKQPSNELEVSDDPSAVPVDAFGTLTIGDGGESRYLGVSAATEAATEPKWDGIKMQAMPHLLHSLASMFPMGSRNTAGPKTSNEAMTLLFLSLPPRPRALNLCETFLEQGSWLSRPIQREELIQNFFTPIYAAKDERDKWGPQAVTATEISPHKMSVLFSIFSLGGLVDLTLPAFNDEAEQYHQCARAAIALRSIFDSPMVETVQAILLLSYYCSNSVQGYTQDSIWMLTSVGSKVAQSVDRDPGQWNMDEKTAEWRRALFWELYSADMFHSFSLGRPPAIGLSYVDCALPKIGSDADSEAQYWNWRYTFNKNIFGSYIEVSLAAKSFNYKTILEFDRKVREMPLPPALDVFLHKDDDEIGLNAYMKGSYLSMVRSITLLYIHKNYFARALLDHPGNPLLSPHATSFLAAARCASAVIRSLSKYFKRFPDIYSRWWTLWAHLFSASMITGLIVTRASSSSMAPAAFAELAIAVELFENGATVSSRIRTGRDILRKLQWKASKLFSQQNSGGGDPSNPNLQANEYPYQETDELALFSGQSRVPLGRHRPPGVALPTSAATSLSTELPTTHDAFDDDRGIHQSTKTSLQMDMHPSLMEHISLFPPLPEVARRVPTAETNFDDIFRSLNTPLTRVDSDMPSFISDIAASDYSLLPPPGSLPLDQNVSQDFSNAPAFEDPLQQLYAETLEADIWGSGGMREEDAEIHIGSSVDEDWMMLLKESSLI
ncbi:hypothetical protein HWV62_23891 [Athelia sp. TMB]|nr:hypothetical protein HWV62_23891 [Athelia sp. TMB]